MADFIELTGARRTQISRLPGAAGRAAQRGDHRVAGDFWGQPAHSRGGRWLCGAGLSGAGTGPFHRVKPGVELGYSPADVAAGVALKAAAEGLEPPGVMQDIQAAIDHALRAGASGKVGLVGYCWGGLLAWRAACQLSGLRAAVPYYGGGMTSGSEIGRTPSCPVLAHFAQQDQSIPLEGVEAFQHAHADVEVHLYQASHGFNCDHRSAYDAAAAALALERTLDFFARHLA